MRVSILILRRPMASSPWLGLLGILLLWTIPSWGVEQGDRVREMQGRSLKGIGAIMVKVEPMNPESEKDGLTTDILQTDAELRLRKAGIKVLPPVPGTPEYLYVRITTAKSKLGTYGFAVEVHFTQLVSLTRDPKVLTYASTWDEGFAATVHESQFARGARDALADILDKFINAYLEQNPKR